MTIKQAQSAIEAGKIDGFSIGERVCSIRQTAIVNDNDKNEARVLPKGTHLLAVKFARGIYGFEFEGKEWTGRKRDFMTFPSGKVVLDTWKA